MSITQSYLNNVMLLIFILYYFSVSPLNPEEKNRIIHVIYVICIVQFRTSYTSVKCVFYVFLWCSFIIYGIILQLPKQCSNIPWVLTVNEILDNLCAFLFLHLLLQLTSFVFYLKENVTSY